MKDKITVIIPIRSRESWRIEKQVQSIRKSGANPHFHVVDYGSSDTYAKDYENICKKLDLQYTHMYSEGLPWNKCRAINYGAKTCKTPFFVMSDADMVYEGNSLQWCLDNYKKKHVYYILAYYFDKKGKLKNKPGEKSPGMFQFMETSAFLETGGFDEKIEFWGDEDSDWLGRLLSIGYTQAWLPNDYKIIHMWHTADNNNSWKRPVTASQNSLRRLFSNTVNPIIEQEWGQALLESDRPILKKMKNETPYILPVKADVLMYYPGMSILTATIPHKFVKIEMGTRVKPISLNTIKEALKLILKPAARYMGRLNMNFDSIYNLLPLMKKNGLLDYYISPDYSSIFLLWS